MNYVLLYTGSFFLLAWGIAHLFPTKSVVAGFGALSVDNRRIITMEWIIEGVALVFVAAVVASATMIDVASQVSRMVYWISFVTLNVLSVISLFTGAKISFLPFRLCPVIFTASSLLILAGGILLEL